ncbi:MAG: hypothetical protein AB1451_16460 [Nitrospirota bacterium]
MVRICSWCRVQLDRSDGGDPTPTHGMCLSCRVRLEREWNAYSAGRPPRPFGRARLAAWWRRVRRALVLVVGRCARALRRF